MIPWCENFIYIVELVPIAYSNFRRIMQWIFFADLRFEKYSYIYFKFFQEYLTNPVQVKVGKVSSPTANVSQILEKVSESDKVYFLAYQYEILYALFFEQCIKSFL